MTMNSKGNLEDHIKNKRKNRSSPINHPQPSRKRWIPQHWDGHLEASPLLHHPHNNLWSGDMDTNQEVNEEETLQRILNNVLKRILRTPTTTPAEIVIAETQIMKKTTNILSQNKNQKTRRKPNQQDSTRPKEPMEEKNWKHTTET